jgi:hypothetical protein
MIEANECPCCSSRKLRSHRARVAPFFADRIWQSGSFETKLLECRECGLFFYQIRPDDEELARLYRGYRGDEYQQQRQAHEPSYTPELNAALGGPDQMVRRRSHIGLQLERWLNPADIHVVVDFGGDRGQFIPAQFDHANRYVQDVSGVEPVDGVVSLDSPADIAPLNPDLVLCCNVLEHVSQPGQVVEMLRGFGHAGTLFYFEVPHEWPLGRSYDALSQIGASFSAKAKARVQTVPLIYHTYLRMRGAEVPPPPTMHEHINHFSEHSLRTVLTTHGFEVLQLSSLVMDDGIAEGETLISCLAR